ncbi:hypothetical protein CDIK_2719 [Cucumispora dikerogammari]|nr:hypothetical protein CDIK_2719 [Cucumispora dikerogammari]
MLYLFFKTHIPDISILMSASVVLTSIQNTSICQNTLNEENKKSLDDVEAEVNSPMSFANDAGSYLLYSINTDLSLSLSSNNTTEISYQYHFDDTLTKNLDNNHKNLTSYSAAFSNSLYSNVFDIEDVGSSAVGIKKVVFEKKIKHK